MCFHEFTNTNNDNEVLLCFHAESIVRFNYFFIDLLFGIWIDFEGFVVVYLWHNNNNYIRGYP